MYLCKLIEPNLGHNPNNQQQSTNNKYIVTKGQINYDYQIYDRQETEYSL